MMWLLEYARYSYLISTVVMIASGLASSLNLGIERSKPPTDNWCLIPWVKFYIDISSIRETRWCVVDTEHGDGGYKY